MKGLKMSQKRKPVKNKNHDQKRFRNTASKTHPANIYKNIMRGGIRF